MKTIYALRNEFVSFPITYQYAVCLEDILVVNSLCMASLERISLNGTQAVCVAGALQGFLVCGVLSVRYLTYRYSTLRSLV